MLIVTANLILRTRPGVVGLTPSELSTILAMGLTAAMIPARGLTGIWLGLMAVPYYRGTPENGWIEHVYPHLPSHLFPTNEGLQTTFLYEGLPTGANIPWNAWFFPLFWWLTLILAGFIVCACIVSSCANSGSNTNVSTTPSLPPSLDLKDDARDDSGRPKWPDSSRGGSSGPDLPLAFGIIGWNIITYFQPPGPASA